MGIPSKWFFFFFHRGVKNRFFVPGQKVFYALISITIFLGGKSYIRTLDTLIFFLGYRFNPRAKPSR